MKKINHNQIEQLFNSIVQKGFQFTDSSIWKQEKQKILRLENSDLQENNFQTFSDYIDYLVLDTIFTTKEDSQWDKQVRTICNSINEKKKQNGNLDKKNTFLFFLFYLPPTLKESLSNEIYNTAVKKIFEIVKEKYSLALFKRNCIYEISSAIQKFDEENKVHYKKLIIKFFNSNKNLLFLQKMDNRLFQAFDSNDQLAIKKQIITNLYGPLKNAKNKPIKFKTKTEQNQYLNNLNQVKKWLTEEKNITFRNESTESNFSKKLDEILESLEKIIQKYQNTSKSKTPQNQEKTQNIELKGKENNQNSILIKKQSATIIETNNQALINFKNVEDIKRSINEISSFLFLNLHDLLTSTDSLSEENKELLDILNKVANDNDKTKQKNAILNSLLNRSEIYSLANIHSILNNYINKNIFTLKFEKQYFDWLEDPNIELVNNYLFTEIEYLIFQNQKALNDELKKETSITKKLKEKINEIILNLSQKTDRNYTNQINFFKLLYYFFYEQNGLNIRNLRVHTFLTNLYKEFDQKKEKQLCKLILMFLIYLADIYQNIKKKQ